MILERIVDPLAEPITSAQVAAWCNAAIASADGLVQADDQDLLDELTTVAREYLEDWTNPHLALVESGWRVTLDKGELADEIRLPVGPLVSVDSVKFYDLDNVETVVTTATYRAVTGEASSVVLLSGETWPDNPRSLGCLVIEITAGYQQTTGAVNQTSTDVAAVVTGSDLSGATGRRVQYVVAAASKGVSFQVYGDDDPAFGTEASVYGPATVAAGASETWTLPSGAKAYYRVKIVSAVAGQAGVATVTGRRGLPPSLLLIGMRELVRFWYVHRGDGLYGGSGGWRGIMTDGQVQGVLERLRSFRSPVVR